MPFKAMGMIKNLRNILNRQHEIAVGILYLTKEVRWDIESSKRSQGIL